MIESSMSRLEVEKVNLILDTYCLGLPKYSAYDAL